MQVSINKNQPFKALAESFEIAPTSSGYQIAYSVTKDGPYTLDTEAIVPANEVLIYLGAQRYGYYMLSGNTDENTIAIL